MLITPEYVFKDVTHITPEFLAEKGIRALVLDIDNTLTADRSQELPDEVAGWLDTMRRAVEALDEAGFADMTLCPETMGKVGQLGTLDEVLALCGVDRRITPCIDFGHLNARTLGGIQSRADYAAILDRMGEALGDERARRFHVHFSRIEFSAGGEKRHWTFAETQFGPEPQPLMELLAERRLEPVIICESAGTQAEDAQAMQRMYEAARG